MAFLNEMPFRRAIYPIRSAAFIGTIDCSITFSLLINLLILSQPTDSLNLSPHVHNPWMSQILQLPSLLYEYYANLQFYCLHSSLRPITSIKVSITDSFGNMGHLNILFTFQVCYGASHLQDA